MQPLPRLASLAVRSSLMCSVAASAVLALGVNPASAIGAGDIASTRNVTSVITKGDTITIKPSNDRSIIDWNSFNIDPGQTLEFRFAGPNWISLNRVGSGSATIDGNLLGCVGACPNYGGNIWIYAADGILFGPNAQVNTGGLLATTSPMLTPDADFLKGGPQGTNDFAFGSSLPDARITVQGGARIGSSGGTLAFVSPVISTESNSSITTPAGASAVHYRAVESYRVQFQRDPGSDLDLLTFEIPSGDAGGSGSLTPITLRGDTNAGNVFVASVSKSSVMNALISAEGTIVATAAASVGGNIVLSGDAAIAGGTAAIPQAGAVDIAVSGTLQGADLRVEASGTTSVSGTIVAKTPAGDGGSIILAGETVSIKDGSLLDASGNTGGLVLVGGGTHGGSIAEENFAAVPIETASVTKVSTGAQIRADGSSGAGGNVVVRSDNVTTFEGSISATGNGGNGGFVELSGSSLTFSGRADLRSSQGGLGTLLLDPNDFAVEIIITDDPGPWGPDDPYLYNEAISSQLAVSNITLNAAEDITIDAPVSNLGGVGRLTLNAGNEITINADLEIIDQALTLNADAIALNAGQITAATVELNATDGSINQSGTSTITAGRVYGSSIGSTTLNGQNEIDVLYEFIAESFSLTNAKTLNLGGDAVVAFGGDLELTTTGASSDLILNADLTTPQTVLLVAGGDITQGGGTITADRATGSSGGATALDSANDIGIVEAFRAGTDFSLTNTQTLHVQGADAKELGFTGVTAGADGAFGDLTLTPAGANTVLTLSTPTGNLAAVGNINVNADTAAAATANISAGGNATISANTLDISSASISAGGNASITASTLDISSATVIAGSDAIVTSDSIAVGGMVQAGGSVSFNAIVSIDVLPSGLVAAGANVVFDPDTITVAGAVQAGGDIDFVADTSIEILATGTVLAGQNASLALRDCQCSGANPAIDVGGSVTAGAGGASGDLTLDTSAAQSPANITLSGNLTAAGAAAPQITMILSAGAISQTGSGTITADILTGSSNGATTLNGANEVDELGAFNAGTEFSLSNVQTLNVQGADVKDLGFTGVTAGSGDLRLATTGSDSDLILSSTTGNLTASASNAVSLSSQGQIAQTGGTIAGGTVMLTAAGDIWIGPDAGGIDAQSTTIESLGGAVVQNGGTLSAADVSIKANTDILIGDVDFTNAVADLEPDEINVALSQPALEPSGTSHIFIDTTSLALDAPGKIVQQNTGTDASPDGIRITSFSPLIQILGQPSVVDLFARVTWGVTEIPPLVVALSPFVVVDGTSNSWRINGCVIHVAPVCASMSDSNLLTFPLGELTFPLNSITPLFTNLRFPSSNEGPNALVSAITSLTFSDIMLLSEDDPDALGNDPTITGSGNDEISR